MRYARHGTIALGRPSLPEAAKRELVAAILGNIAIRVPFSECIATPRLVSAPEGTVPWASVWVIDPTRGDEIGALDYEPPFEVHGHLTGLLRRVDFPDPEWEY